MVLYYCHARPGGYVLAAAALLGALLWLLLLFRVLGSTADTFFSPILGQLSQELGLPPRLAGGAMQHYSTTHSLLELELLLWPLVSEALRPGAGAGWRHGRLRGRHLAEVLERGSMGWDSTCSAELCRFCLASKSAGQVAHHACPRVAL